MLKWTSKGGLTPEHALHLTSLSPGLDYGDYVETESPPSLGNQIAQRSALVARATKQASRADNLPSAKMAHTEGHSVKPVSSCTPDLPKYPRAFAPNSPSKSEKCIVPGITQPKRSKSLSLPPTPLVSVSSRTSSVGEQKKRSVFAKIKQMFRKNSSKKMEQYSLSRPSENSPVFGRKYAETSGSKIWDSHKAEVTTVPSTRLARLLEAKKEERKNSRVLGSSQTPEKALLQSKYPRNLNTESRYEDHQYQDNDVKSYGASYVDTFLFLPSAANVSTDKYSTVGAVIDPGTKQSHPTLVSKKSHRRSNNFDERKQSDRMNAKIPPRCPESSHEISKRSASLCTDEDSTKNISRTSKKMEKKRKSTSSDSNLTGPGEGIKRIPPKRSTSCVQSARLSQPQRKPSLFEFDVRNDDIISQKIRVMPSSAELITKAKNALTPTHRSMSPLSSYSRTVLPGNSPQSKVQKIEGDRTSGNFRWSLSDDGNLIISPAKKQLDYCPLNEKMAAPPFTTNNNNGHRELQHRELTPLAGTSPVRKGLPRLFAEQEEIVRRKKLGTSTPPVSFVNSGGLPCSGSRVRDMVNSIENSPERLEAIVPHADIKSARDKSKKIDDSVTGPKATQMPPCPMQFSTSDHNKWREQVGNLVLDLKQHLEGNVDGEAMNLWDQTRKRRRSYENYSPTQLSQKQMHAVDISGKHSDSMVDTSSTYIKDKLGHAQEKEIAIQEAERLTGHLRTELGSTDSEPMPTIFESRETSESVPMAADTPPESNELITIKEGKSGTINASSGEPEKCEKYFDYPVKDITEDTQKTALAEQEQWKKSDSGDMSEPAGHSHDVSVPMKPWTAIAKAETHGEADRVPAISDHLNQFITDDNCVSTKETDAFKLQSELITQQDNDASSELPECGPLCLSSAKEKNYKDKTDVESCSADTKSTYMFHQRHNLRNKKPDAQCQTQNRDAMLPPVTITCESVGFSPTVDAISSSFSHSIVMGSPTTSPSSKGFSLGNHAAGYNSLETPCDSQAVSHSSPLSMHDISVATSYRPKVASESLICVFDSPEVSQDTHGRPSSNLYEGKTGEYEIMRCNRIKPNIIENSFVTHGQDNDSDTHSYGSYTNSICTDNSDIESPEPSGNLVNAVACDRLPEATTSHQLSLKSDSRVKDEEKADTFVRRVHEPLLSDAEDNVKDTFHYHQKIVSDDETQGNTVLTSPALYEMDPRNLSDDLLPRDKDEGITDIKAPQSMVMQDCSTLEELHDQNIDLLSVKPWDSQSNVTNEHSDGKMCVQTSVSHLVFVQSASKRDLVVPLNKEPLSDDSSIFQMPSCALQEFHLGTEIDSEANILRTKKKVSFAADITSPFETSKSDDVAVIEPTPPLQDDREFDAVNGDSNILDPREKASSIDLSSSFSCKSNGTPAATPQITSTSADDVSWWGPEVIEDIEFFHDQNVWVDVKSQEHKVTQASPPKALSTTNKRIRAQDDDQAPEKLAHSKNIMTLSNFLIQRADSPQFELDTVEREISPVWQASCSSATSAQVISTDLTHKEAPKSDNLKTMADSINDNDRVSGGRDSADERTTVDNDDADVTITSCPSRPAAAVESSPNKEVCENKESVKSIASEATSIVEMAALRGYCYEEKSSVSSADSNTYNVSPSALHCENKRSPWWDRPVVSPDEIGRLSEPEADCETSSNDEHDSEKHQSSPANSPAKENTGGKKDQADTSSLSDAYEESGRQCPTTINEIVQIQKQINKNSTAKTLQEVNEHISIINEMKTTEVKPPNHVRKMNDLTSEEVKPLNPSVIHESIIDADSSENESLNVQKEKGERQQCITGDYATGSRKKSRPGMRPKKRNKHRRESSSELDKTPDCSPLSGENHDDSTCTTLSDKQVAGLKSNVGQIKPRHPGKRSHGGDNDREQENEEPGVEMDEFVHGARSAKFKRRACHKKKAANESTQTPEVTQQAGKSSTATNVEVRHSSQALLKAPVKNTKAKCEQDIARKPTVTPMTLCRKGLKPPVEDQSGSFGDSSEDLTFDTACSTQVKPLAVDSGYGCKTWTGVAANLLCWPLRHTRNSGLQNEPSQLSGKNLDLGRCVQEVSQQEPEDASTSHGHASHPIRLDNQQLRYIVHQTQENHQHEADYDNNLWPGRQIFAAKLHEQSLLQKPYQFSKSQLTSSYWSNEPTCPLSCSQAPFPSQQTRGHEHVQPQREPQQRQSQQQGQHATDHSDPGRPQQTQLTRQPPSPTCGGQSHNTPQHQENHVAVPSDANPTKSKFDSQPGQWLFIATFFVFQLFLHWLYAR